MDKKSKRSLDSEICKLIKKLGSDDGMNRKEARNALIAKGKASIVYLMELISDKKHIYRWEAMKTLEEIGEPDLIPVFIQALEDDKSDIRWIAAEGLIKLGLFSIEPLLKRVLEKPDSIFVLAGSHHVLLELRDTGMLPKGFNVNKLLSALKNPGWLENVVPLTYKLLNNLK